MEPINVPRNSERPVTVTLGGQEYTVVLRDYLGLPSWDRYKGNLPHDAIIDTIPAWRHLIVNTDSLVLRTLYINVGGESTSITWYVGEEQKLVMHTVSAASPVAYVSNPKILRDTKVDATVRLHANTVEMLSAT